MRDGVHLRTRVADVGAPVVLGPALDGDGTAVLVYGLPYLDPDAARRPLSPDDAPLPRSHEAVMRAAMDRVRADVAVRRSAAAGPALRVVVVAHAFVLGGQASESERDIRVGGVDHVPAEVFAGADYVALGHLHGPQRVAGPPGTVLRYSGSPLAYSFSEQHHTKSSVLVDLGADGVVGDVSLLPAPVPRRLSDVTGTLESLLGPAGEPFTGDWVRVVVTDAARPPELFARVRRRFPHALVVQHRPPVVDRPAAGGVTAAHDPLEVAAQFVEHVTGAGPSSAEVAVLRQALEHSLAAERSA
jgi:exonuclease SbcD